MGLRNVKLYFEFILMSAGGFIFVILSLFVHLPIESWRVSSAYYFLSISIPFILVANLVLLIYWLISMNLRFFLPLLTLVVNFEAVVAVFGFSAHSPVINSNSALTVCTYNINYFSYESKPESVVQIADFARKNRIDILLLQEFRTNPLYNMREIRGEFDFLPYVSENISHNGLAIFSRYPILRSRNSTFVNSNNGTMWADILIDGDTIRVFNNHLQTTGISRLKGFSLSDKLSAAGRNYELRCKQSTFVRQMIDTTKYPLIVGGDFNDTPFSSTTRTIGAKLSDTFIEKGRGPGGTYLNNYFLTRIDYLFHDKKFKTTSYMVGKQAFSDHKPVMAVMEYQN